MNAGQTLCSEHDGLSQQMRCSLAIDTSGEFGSFVFEDAKSGVRIFYEWSTADKSHAVALPEVLGRCQQFLHSADVIVVGTGPGSYTGIRLAITSANALSLALPKRPRVYGVENHRAAICEIFSGRTPVWDSSSSSKNSFMLITDAKADKAAVTLFDEHAVRELESVTPQLLDWATAEALSNNRKTFLTHRIWGWPEDWVLKTTADSLLKYFRRGVEQPGISNPPQPVYLHGQGFRKFVPEQL